MRYCEVGRGGHVVRVSAIGLGEMPLSLRSRPDEDQAIRAIHASLDAGVTLIDTADAYCADSRDVGQCERLVAKAVACYGADTSEILVATKGGHTRTAAGGWGRDGRPEYLKRAAEASLKALGVDAIGLYRFHRPDPNVPYADSVDAIKELLDEGKILMAGVSRDSVGGCCRHRSHRRRGRRARWFVAVTPILG
jgi:aryl-alcohol dehydrogenase-like predicted oxidoreductase